MRDAGRAELSDPTTESVPLIPRHLVDPDGPLILISNDLVDEITNIRLAVLWEPADERGDRADQKRL